MDRKDEIILQQMDLIRSMTERTSVAWTRIFGARP